MYLPPYNSLLVLAYEHEKVRAAAASSGIEQ